jgi:hypothetical protein
MVIQLKRAAPLIKLDGKIEFIFDEQLRDKDIIKYVSALQKRDQILRSSSAMNRNGKKKRNFCRSRPPTQLLGGPADIEKSGWRASQLLNFLGSQSVISPR